jgi:type I restriction enzyme, S subunit
MAHKFPENWKAYKLDQLGLVARGRSRHRPRNEPSLYGGEYPFFQTGDIKAANLYLADYTQTYNEKGLAQSKLWGPETLCITIAANIADTAILGIRGCFPDSVIGFIPDKKAADVHFVKYYIDMIKLDMQQVSHGTTQDNLSLDKLLRFDFIIPLVDEQRKIAAILSAYDNLIENNLRRIKILEEMAQNLYREWFVNFRFPGHEKAQFVDSPLGRIPEGWKAKRLDEFGNIVTGKTPSKKKLEYYGRDVPFIKLPDMHNSMHCIATQDSLSVSGANSQKSKMIPPKSLCISCIGTVGIVVITSVASQTNQQINSIVLRRDEDLEFLYYTLVEIKPKIELYSATGATMNNLSRGKFIALEVLCPTEVLIDKFHLSLSPFFELILCLQRKNSALRQTRDFLLPKLISGEVDVSELDISVPEEIAI